MKISGKLVVAGAAIIAISAGCGGGNSSPAAIDPVIRTDGSISISLTDGPWEDAQAMILHVTGIDLGHANGDVIQLGLLGGSMSIDMMQLQKWRVRTLDSGDGGANGTIRMDAITD